ncbi:MAG TPA: multicopper oxidase domain-containing protein [Gemmatimonadales bacterium]|nr:multicopper oxidase domain-containing protein [Gemmatimonadales bacterium]
MTTPGEVKMLGRSLSILVLLGAMLASGKRGDLSAVRPNPNIDRAGVLHDGVLTVTLEAKQATWRIDGPNRPAQSFAVFAEPGKQPMMPGPLLRVPAGTELRISVRNALSTPLTFFIPAAVHGGPQQMAAMDTIVIAPAAVGQLVTHATEPGNYVYRATTSARVDQLTRVEGALTGALVVDSTGAPDRLYDRVFVMMTTLDSATVVHVESTARPLQFGAPGIRQVFTINGLAWPNTERIAATAGDSLHWRVINASAEVHPMHLHGFYYRVDAFDGPGVEGQERPVPGQMVVTQFMTPFSAMSMSWSPDRPGNWLFHCHFAIHLQPDTLSRAPDDPHLRGMVGLVLGVVVGARPGASGAALPAAARHFRLVAIADSTATFTRSPQTVSPMRFVLEERGHQVDTKRAISPELDLTRGEPVAITIVNHLPEPTAVHWHGIELADSYMDGVPGVSGAGARLTPEIAPGDSFEARFTPPRSGTFMYHAHMDEVREEQAGLEGALIVRDPGAPPSPDDHVFLLKGNYRYSGRYPVELNGEVSPDTIVLHVGRQARLRFMNLAKTTVAPTFALTARADSAQHLEDDTMIVRWVPLAKDGFDVPAARQTPHRAYQLVAMGETYDFAYTPLYPGALRLEVRGARDDLLKVQVPIRVEQ